MPTLLYHPAGCVSAPLLATFMGIGAIPHRRAAQVPPRETVIRWGSAARLAAPPAREINPGASLRAYSTRLDQLRLLEAGDVQVPPFGPTGEDFELPVLARDFPRGRQNSHGRGITVYTREGIYHYRKHDMYMALIPKHRQFRVHVVGESTRTRELIHRTEIAPTRGFIRNDEIRVLTPIWNLTSDFIYWSVQGDRPRGVIPAAVAAVRALSLDFGAVDIITTEDGSVYVLEVNTAPGLGESTLAWYGTQLSKLIGHPVAAREVAA